MKIFEIGGYNMRKKIFAMNLAVVLVISIVISSVVITSNADKAKAYSVAKPVNKIDNVAGVQTIHNEKLSNFTTTFDFTPKTSETSVALRYDYDNDLKKVAIKENFESYKLGDVIYGNITVVSGGARGNVGSIMHLRALIMKLLFGFIRIIVIGER